MGRLNNKVILITGGSRGLGAEMSNLFKSEGAITISLNINNSPIDNEIEYYQVDVSDSNNVNTTIKKVIKKYGRIDVLVNNAGITSDALVNKMTDEQWQEVISVNLTGTFYMTRAVSKFMLEAGKGSIINISSIVGEYGNVGQSNYAASKAGIIGLTYTWAKEFTRKGAKIRTNAIAPGYINTEMMQTVPEKILNTMIEKNPLKRLGEPNEIAEAALFLASDESSFVNGHVLSVNGGMKL